MYKGINQQTVSTSQFIYIYSQGLLNLQDLRRTMNFALRFYEGSEG